MFRDETNTCKKVHSAGYEKKGSVPILLFGQTWKSECYRCYDQFLSELIIVATESVPK